MREQTLLPSSETESRARVGKETVYQWKKSKVIGHVAKANRRKTEKLGQPIAQASAVVRENATDQRQDRAAEYGPPQEL
jgi:hypothetical protein